MIYEHELWLDSNGREGKQANFQDRDASGANLRGVNFRGVNFRGADLMYAWMSRCDLRGADFTGANLRNINLSRVDLRGAIGLPDIEQFPIDAAIAEAVEKDGLDMSDWHCGTTHCRGGWAVTLHPQGPELERKHGVAAAAAFIYNACSKLDITPDWHASNEDALEDIRRLA